MRKIAFLTLLTFTLFSCEQAAEQSEFQVGMVEMNDAKSNAMIAFNDAYLAGDFTGQLDIFSDTAKAYINGQLTTPDAMMEAFLEGRTHYTDIKNLNRATTTTTYDNGRVFSNYWFVWEGVSKSTGKTVTTPAHGYFTWQGDQVVQVGYIFDSVDYVGNMGNSDEAEAEQL